MMKNTLLLLLISFTIMSCGDDQGAIDETVIVDHLNANNLSAERSPEGVYYIIHNPGDVEKPSINSTINVQYSGYLLNGSVFDSSDDFTSGLWQVIDGWQIAIPLIGKGGSITFFIPSDYAYGSDGTVSIPGNTVIAFDVTLIDFQ